MAHCYIYGMFKENSKKALKTAQSMGAWGACSYSCDMEAPKKDPFDLIPEKDGDISFELFGRSPWDKLHKIAKAICKKGNDYRVEISEWEVPIRY